VQPTAANVDEPARGMKPPPIAMTLYSFINSPDANQRDQKDHEPRQQISYPA
jgi:hypothetical protein